MEQRRPLPPEKITEIEKIPKFQKEGLPLYNVRRFTLESVRTNTEINLPGDYLAAFTDGTLVGITVRFNTATNDEIPLSEFNPIRSAKFEKFYLTTTVQTGKYLRIFVGREVFVTAEKEITQKAGKVPLYTITSDKDLHFTGSIAQNAKEDENITGLLENRITITGIAIQSDQQLDYRLIFWYNDLFDDTDLDVDAFISEQEMDLASYGYQIGGTGQWYMAVDGLEIGYEDSDGTNELHVSLQNLSATAKTAGAAGEVRILFKYSPRA